MKTPEHGQVCLYTIRKLREASLWACMAFTCGGASSEGPAMGWVSQEGEEGILSSRG